MVPRYFHITLVSGNLPAHSEPRTVGQGVGLLHIHISFHGWKAEASHSFLPIDRWWESANLSAYNEMEKAPRHGEVNIPCREKGLPEIPQGADGGQSQART